MFASFGPPFHCAGQYTDAESGLQYLRNRYYDPTTTQFLSVDPLVANTGQPFSYAGDNPVNAADPSGLCQAGFVSLPFGGSEPCSSDIGAEAVQATSYVATRGRVEHAAVHGLLDAVAFVPYADYYLSFRTLSTVLLPSPVACSLASFQDWGLGADIGLDKFKNSTVSNNEKPNDEGRYIYLLTVHVGPQVWGPGWWIHDPRKVDVWPQSSYPWEAGFGPPQP